MRGLHFGTLRQWHWISSALCLAGMLLFAFTGITLNHAGRIEARPLTQTHERQVPEPLLQALQASTEATSSAQLPSELQRWLRSELGLQLPRRPLEWHADELYIGLPRPGGDSWISIDLQAGELLYERTDRGWIAWLNDLHKGRHTGLAWSLFIDLFALACLVFSGSGLWLLVRQSGMRRLTWPVTSAGLLIPLLIILLTLH